MTEITAGMLDYFNRPDFSNDLRDIDPAHCNKVFEPVEYESLSRWKKRREKLIKKLKIAMAVYPCPERTPLNPEVFDAIPFNGFQVAKFRFEAIPGYYVTGNIFTPDKPGRFPAILCPHGHWDNGRLVKNE